MNFINMFLSIEQAILDNRRITEVYISVNIGETISMSTYISGKYVQGGALTTINHRIQ